MRVKGGSNPGKFSVEEIPNKPGWCLCRFYENAREYTVETENGTETGWEYDEYHLQQEGAKASLEKDIAGNYDVYLAAAKATEAPSETERLRADVDFIAVMTGVNL